MGKKDMPRTGNGRTGGKKPDGVVTRLANGVKAIVQADTPKSTPRKRSKWFG
jgi:hypothetical protein